MRSIIICIAVALSAMLGAAAGVFIEREYRERSIAAERKKDAEAKAEARRVVENMQAAVYKWRKVRQKDELTGREVSAVAKQIRGSSGDDPNLVLIRCDGANMAVVLGSSGYWGKTSEGPFKDFVPVAYRPDGGSIRYVRANPSTNGRYAILTAHQSKEMVESMLRAEKIVVRVSDYRGVEHTTTIPLKEDGAADLLIALAKECGTGLDLP